MTKKTIHKQSQFRLKPACAALLLAFAVQTTQANPIGASVVNGQASFATVGNTLTVTNTPGAIINWQGFSIGANEITRFAQQSASSAVLNRVISNNPSSILGALQSNGRVFLVNPNGIVFGQGSTINVAGLVATSLNLSNADFIAGRYNFTDVPGAQNISNAGNLTAQSGGQIYLIAPNVENTGVITAPNGEILLAAGHSVELVDTANPNLRVNITAPAGDATNVGQLVAEAGSLGLFGTMVRNSGTVSADSATLQGGKIVFKASQRTEISGIVTADGTTGGTIQALGNQVGIMDGATVTSNGAQGGGTILIGGDYQGKNSDVPNAQVTYVAPTASISADATNAGDGGKVIVWADDTTRAYGNISVRGGTNGGDGGFVETSGHNYLDFQGRVDTRAPQGSDGTLLLDPADITIDNSVDSLNGGAFSGGWFYGATGNSTLTWATINLQSGSLEIRTNSAGTGGLGDININASGTVTGPTTLTLLANNDINFGTLSPVSVSGSGDFNLIAGWNNTGWAVNPGTGKITFGPSSILTGGNIWFNAGNAIIQDLSATITANTLGIGGYGGVSLPGTNMVNTLAANISSGGSLNFSNGQALTIGIATYSNGINAWGNPNPINITTTAGDLTVAQPIVSDGLGGSPITLTAANTLTLNAAVTSTFNASPAGPVVLEAVGGSVTSNASGIITAGGLKVVSGGSVTLNANNAINNLAGSSVSSFQFSNSKGFTVTTVGAVAPVIGLTASTGDITLKAGGLDSLLTISQNVQATTGSVFYVADNLAHNASTTSGSVGNFVELKPFTAATNIEFSAAADAAGLLRLSSGELNNFSTPLLRVGNSTVAGNIAITESVAPGAFSSLSLITGGAITQDIGCTITIANLNADGWLGVTLNEANDITNLGGHTNTGNFAFTDVNAINVGLVDVNNGITVDTSGGITLTAGSSVSQSAAALLTAPTSLTVIAANGIILNGALSTTGGNVLLNANKAGVGGAIVMNTGSSITSNGGNITLGGGTAGDGTGNAIGTSTYVEGVSLNGATLNAGGGNIAMNGTGFAGTVFADGIYVTGTSLVQTNAAGSIALNGTGGAGTDDNNGVRIGTTSSITSVDGAISLIGQGGVSTGLRNMGVYVHAGAAISATGIGTITLDGKGGSSGTAGSSNRGVRVASGAVITSNSGNIGIIGLGGYDGDGVQVAGASTVQSTSGGINIFGTSGNGIGSDYGVYVTASDVGSGNTLITSGGNILVNGTSMATAGLSNHGVRIGTRSQVIATGTGNIDMTGAGGLGGDGISENVTGTLSTAGLLTVNSTGGAILNGANAVGSFSAVNYASGNIELTNTVATLAIENISNWGGGNITVLNTGDIDFASTQQFGGGVSANWFNSTATLTATGKITKSGSAMLDVQAASISLNAATGIGSSTSPIMVNDNPIASLHFNNTTSGDVFISSDYAMHVDDGNNGGGNITLVSTGLGCCVGSMIQLNRDIVNGNVTASGNITYVADNFNVINLSGTGTFGQTISGAGVANHVQVTPYTASRAIELDSNPSAIKGGATLMLTQGELDLFNSPKLIVGSQVALGDAVNAGDIFISNYAGGGGANVAFAPMASGGVDNIELRTGGNLGFAAIAVGLAAPSITVNAGGNVSHGLAAADFDTSPYNGNISITAGGAIGSGGDVIFNAGSGTVNLSASGNIAANGAGGDIFFLSSGGAVALNGPLTATGLVDISGVGVTNVSTITGPNGVTINAGTGLLDNSAGTITNGGGAATIFLSANTMSLANGVITGGTGNIILTPYYSSTQPVNLGSTVTNTLSLLGTDLQTITTAGELGIGSYDNTGGITVGGVITAANLAGLTGIFYIESQKIAVNAALTSPVTVFLWATGGAITETGSIAAPSLTTNAVGGTTLNGANAVGIFSAMDTGAVSLTNTAATLALGSITAASLMVNNTGSIAVYSSLSASGTGNAIVLDAGAGSFINNAGATALSAPNGRWLIYAASPSSVTKGGLISAFRHYNATYANYASPTETGNGFIYASTPGALSVDTTLASGVASNTYGTTPTAIFGYTISNSAIADNEDLALIAGTPVFTPTLSSITPVGGYTVSYLNGLNSAAGYTFTPGVGLAYTVNPALLTVAANNASKTYDAIPYSGGNGVVYSGLVNGEGAGVLGGTLTYSGTSQGAVNAGSYLITPGGLTSSNYTISFVDGILTINPAALALLSVTANNASKTYGTTLTFAGTEFTPVGLLGGDTIGSVTLTSPGAVNTANAGTYAITPSNAVFSVGNASNYTISYVNGQLTVNPAALTVTANARSKVYGNTDPALTYVASGLLFTDTLTGGLTRTTGENVGVYAITQGTLANPNYTISYTGNNLSITRAALTVAANNASKTYDAIPYSGGNGVTYTGLTHGDSAAALGGTLTYGGTSQGAVNAGSYVITPGGLTSGNYTISFVDGILTINPAGLTLLSVTANNASKTYGTTLTFAGTEFTPVGLLGGDTIGSVTLTSPGAVNTANVGTYAITPSNAVFSVGHASNYTLSYVNGQLTVNPAALTVSANAQSKVYGNTDPALTYVASGLLFTDTLTGGLTRTTGENVGVYAITQGTLANPNYTISYTGNNLGITPAALTVAANALSKTAGNIDPLLTYMVTGLKLADTEATTLSGALARLAGETAGVYPINQGTLTLLSTNYTMNYIPADFSILTRAVTPTLLNNLMNDIVVIPHAPTDDATPDADAKKKDAEADAQDADALAAELAPAAAQMPVCK